MSNFDKPPIPAEKEIDPLEDGSFVLFGGMKDTFKSSEKNANDELVELTSGKELMEKFEKNQIFEAKMGKEQKIIEIKEYVREIMELSGNAFGGSAGASIREEAKKLYKEINSFVITLNEEDMRDPDIKKELKSLFDHDTALRTILGSSEREAELTVGR